MTKDEYDAGCARALKLTQTCSAEFHDEHHGWRLNLDEINASIEGWATEDEARAGALEHVKAMIGIPTLAQVASAWMDLRATRDRRLALTDYVEGYLTEPAAFTYLPESVRSAIDANADEWRTWRQELRDLPSTLDDMGTLALVRGETAWPDPPAAPALVLA